MVNIVYSVHGEGMGHAIRSGVVIAHLLRKGHKVLVTSFGRPLVYLQQKGFNTLSIEGFNIVYRSNKVDLFDTLVYGSLKLPQAARKNIRSFRGVLKSFNPSLVISDFEPFSEFVHKLYRIPVILINNLHIVKAGKIPVKHRNMLSFLAARITVSLFDCFYDYALITTFFYPKIRGKNIFLFPPLLRENILSAKPKRGKHLLVYQTSQSNDALHEVLRKIGIPSVVYGFGRNDTCGQVRYKRFDEEEFFTDLANCMAVVTNGGFTLITEAIHLKKPLLCFPVEQQFEQMLNAHYVENLGYGMSAPKTTESSLVRFLKKIDVFQKNLNTRPQEDNSRLFGFLDELIVQTGYR
ncbi:hypothetical protein COY95_01505 [Candidatus Woesearchaeota archaeon CG_4_10_14_0_8_um_filter_47_5]|nr:MAG: hypothetical protein COY95_01505 [Candidatus Woesearchaeota archaeon CG_4_10_14_0_8_um_filter_47_5]